MLKDLDESLRAMLADASLQQEFPELAASVVSFDRPSDGFAPGQSTVNLFLYEIRENLELRSNESSVVVTNGKASVQASPLRFDCNYLVTAWPTGAAGVTQAEHTLLGQALEVFARNPLIPQNFLKGRLATAEPVPPLRVAQSEPNRNMAEFWAAIGNRIHPALTLTATVAIAPPPRQAGPVVSSGDARIRDGVDPQGAIVSETFQIAGRVTQAGGAPVAKGTVRVSGGGPSAVTDAGGVYRLLGLTAGQALLEVVVAGAVVKQFTVKLPAVAAATFDIQV